MAYGEVIIIPSDDIAEGEIRQKIIMNHMEAIEDFIRKYKLNYDLKNLDYQAAPIALARDGNLIIKIIYDQKMAIFYLPEKISERQKNWFDYNKFDLTKYVKIGGYAINNDNIDEVYGLNNILSKVNGNRKR